MRAAIDSALSKVASRKLIAWIASTIALAAGSIDADAWVAVTCVYVSAQGVADVAATVLGARRGE
jgi:hypothetical protein